MGKENGRGVITSTNEDAIEGTIGTAEGIIFEWEKTLKDFEEFDGANQIEEKVNKSPNNTIEFNKLQLPQMLDENGTDLFLLT